jgi:hypothetical protein
VRVAILAGTIGAAMALALAQTQAPQHALTR